MNFPLINKTLRGTLIDFIPEDLIKVCRCFYYMISSIYKNTSFKYFKYHDIYLGETLFDFVYDDIKNLIDNKIIEIIREQMHQYLENSYYERMNYKEPGLNVPDRPIWYRRHNNMWYPVPTTKETIDTQKIVANNKPEKPFTLINKPPPSRRQRKPIFPKKQNYYSQPIKFNKTKQNFGSGR